MQQRKGGRITMNETVITNNDVGTTDTPLAENEHVKELLGILRENGKDDTGLTALINHVGEMENFVKLAESRIADMKAQLDEMKEVQDHPVRHALQNTIKALETKIVEIKEQIKELKNNIIEGCKNAVGAFKEKGAAVLDRLASFFNIKGFLSSINKNIDESIMLDDKAMAKIESFSKEYHETGRHLKNMGRVLIGKPPIDVAKESGKLAKAVSLPYKAHKTIQLKMKTGVIAMIGSLARLEQRTTANREAKMATSGEKKPSLARKLKVNKERIRQKDLERLLPERARVQGVEV
jgi:hypothetical protein